MDSGSTWMRTGSSLRAERTRCTSPSAWESGGRVGARHPDDQARRAVVHLDRAEDLGAGRLVEQRERVVDGSGLAGDRREPAGGRQVRLGARRSPPAPAKPAGSHRTSAWTPGWDGSPTTSTWPPGATSAGGAAPPAKRLLVGAQVGPGQGQPGVEEDHGGVAAVGHGLGTRRRHHDRGPVRHGRHDVVATRGHDRRGGEGPTQLLGGTPLAHHRGAEPAVAAHGTGPRVDDGAAPPARRRDGRAGDAERPGADRAAGRRTAPLAGQGRRRTRAAASARGPGRGRARPAARRAPASASAPRGPAGRARARGRSAPAIGHRHRVPERLARRGDLVRPARSPAAARPRRSGRSRRPAPRRPRRWARVSRTSRAWGYGARGSACRSSPSSQIATSPRSCTGANAAARVPTTIRRVPPGHREELAVAPRRPRAGGQHDVVTGPEQLGQGRVERGRRRAGRARTRTLPRPPDRVSAAAAASRRGQSSPGSGRPDRPRCASGLPGDRGTRRPPGTPTTPPRAAAHQRVTAPPRATTASRWSRGAAARRAGARRSGCRRTARPAPRPARRPPAASTGSGLTTRCSGVRVPVCSVSAARATTKPVERLARRSAP